MTGPAPDRFTFVEARSEAPRSFADAVRDGLSASPKRLPCAYFYDPAGSRLFEEICTLPEYYLTRAERQILEVRAREVAARFAEPPTLVELGSGSAAKTRLLIEALLGRHGALRYVPIDISGAVLEESSVALLADYPSLRILAVAAEYREGVRWLRREVSGPKLVIWLGSNVGNLDRPEAAAFLGALRRTMAAGDGMLVGIDLRKDKGVLERAYDDGRGVTAAFNKNLLARINRELGGRFDLASFRHRAVYDEGEGRVEMYLVSLRAQTVRVDALDLGVSFAAGEAIHTENSYKYSPAEIAALADAARFGIEAQWFDAEQRFGEVLLAPA